MRRQSSLWLLRSLLFPPKGFSGKRRRLLGAALLITLVMIPLVLSLTFMDGMMGGITDKYILLQDGHIQMNSAERLFITNTSVEGIDARIYSADFVTIGYGIVYSRNATAEIRIKGVDPSYFNERRLAQFSIQGDLLEKDGNLPAVMLSSSTAERLGVGVGDRLALMIVPDVSVAVVRPVLAQVTSIFNSGYHQLDASLVFMGIDDALKLFPAVKSARTEILVNREAAGEIDEVISSITRHLNKSYDFSTWDEFNQAVYQNFITSRQVILLVFLMIILVAGVYVSSIAGEIVQDNFQSIAVLKAMGTHTSMIRRAYFYTVTCITCIGMLCGVGLGLLLGTRLGDVLSLFAASGLPGLQYYLLDFPIVVSWSDLLLVACALLGISSITVLFTLRRIGKISPLELLQQD